jgi:hypothetical protein
MYSTWYVSRKDTMEISHLSNDVMPTWGDNYGIANIKQDTVELVIPGDTFMWNERSTLLQLQRQHNSISHDLLELPELLNNQQENRSKIFLNSLDKRSDTDRKVPLVQFLAFFYFSFLWMMRC